MNITLSETQLKQIIKESVKNIVLKEQQIKIDGLNVPVDFINNQYHIGNHIFDHIGNPDDNGIARVSLNRKMNYIDSNGNLLSPNQWFDYAQAYFDNDYAKVRVNDKTLLLNINGELIDENIENI